MRVASRALAGALRPGRERSQDSVMWAASPSGASSGMRWATSGMTRARASGALAAATGQLYGRGMPGVMSQAWGMMAPGAMAEFQAGLGKERDILLPGEEILRRVGKHRM